MQTRGWPADGINQAQFSYDCTFTICEPRIPEHPLTQAHERWRNRSNPA